MLVKVISFVIVGWRVNYLKFEWDESKNIINIQKHNVSFEEAMTVFKDSKAVLRYDEDHSETEDRFNIIGMSQLSKLLDCLPLLP